MGSIEMHINSKLTPEQIKAHMAVCAMCNALQWEKPPVILCHTPEDWHLSLEDAHSISQIVGEPPDMSKGWEDRIETDAKLKTTIELIEERAVKRKKSIFMKMNYMAEISPEVTEIQLAFAALYNAIRYSFQPELLVHHADEIWTLSGGHAAEFIRSHRTPPDMSGNFWERIDTDPLMKETFEYMKERAIKRKK